MQVRGKRLTIDKHAYDGMNAERPPVQPPLVEFVLEEADQDDGHQALKAIGGRTIIVYYRETEDEIYVKSVSATRRKLAP